MKEILNLNVKGTILIASIAPSFPAYFDCHPFQLVTALKRVGFDYVEETAVVLPDIVKKRKEICLKYKRPMLGESCPKVIELIKTDYPHLIENIAPIPSPMELHGKLLHEKYGVNSETVFISPCLHKKVENAIKNVFDHVFTFLEIEELILQRIRKPLNELELTEFDQSASYLDRHAVLITPYHGIGDCRNFLNHFNANGEPGFTELLFCEGGCARTALKSSSIDNTISASEKIYMAWEEKNP